MKKYQLADLVNGAFGDVFDTLEEAEAELSIEVEEGKRLNRENSEDGSELSSDGTTAESFLFIVDAETGEEI